MKKRNVNCFLFILIVLLAGCSNGNNENEVVVTENNLENNKDKEENELLNNEDGNIDNEINNENETIGHTKSFELVEMETELIPKNVEQVLKFPVGEFNEEDSLRSSDVLQQAIEEMPPLDEQATNVELENYIYQVVSLYAASYPDPNQMLNRWEQLAFGSPEVEEGSRYEMKENLNVEILLDSSGSMREEIDGKAKMDIAKEAITEFVEELPEEANVSLRVYGHIGESQEVSCERVDRVYDLQPYEAEAFGETLEEFFPNGWTPIAKAVEDTHEDYQDLSGEENTNLIYLVSDGIETCGGDPVKAAEELGQSDIMPIVNIIGFDVPSDEQQQLKDMASAAEGVYAVADDQSQLKEELSRGNDMARVWSSWKTSSNLEISSTRVKQSLDLHGELNDWRMNNHREFLINRQILRDLESNEQISSTQSIEARNMIDDRNDAIKTIGDEIYELLMDENNDTHDKMRKQVEELYEEQGTDR